MSKKKKKNSLREARTINVQSFLSRFYGIKNEGIATMTHQNASSLFPQLRRTSFEFVQKNPELVSTGKIVLVEDATHSQAPYWLPDLTMVDDSILGCDERELTVKKIVETFERAINGGFETLLIVEGDESLDPYLFQEVTLHDDFLQEETFSSFVETGQKHVGIVLENDATVKSYSVLSHGDNYATTVALPPLQRQATGITRKTDAISVFYEGQVLGFVIDGETRIIEDFYDLQKELMRFIPDASQDFIVETKPMPAEEVPKFDDFHEMTTYELEKLMHVYRSSGQTAHYHAAKRELTKRTKANKLYRIEKEKIKIKEMLKGEE